MDVHFFRMPKDKKMPKKKRHRKKFMKKNLVSVYQSVTLTSIGEDYKSERGITIAPITTTTANVHYIADMRRE